MIDSGNANRGSLNVTESTHGYPVPSPFKGKVQRLVQRDVRRGCYRLKCKSAY